MVAEMPGALDKRQRDAEAGDLEGAVKVSMKGAVEEGLQKEVAGGVRYGRTGTGMHRYSRRSCWTTAPWVQEAGIAQDAAKRNSWVDNWPNE